MQQGVSKYKYIVGPVERFDQKNEMFKRPRWQPELRQMGQDVFNPIAPQEEKDGYGIRERALQNAAWYVETGFAEGVRIHNTGLYSWESQSIGLTPIPPEFKYEVTDPAQMSGTIKKVAGFFGADEVGICELDPRWVYSHYFQMMTREHGPLEVPSECKYAIAIAVEMDYEMMKTSPAGIAGAATGLGYSRMAFTAGLLAEFIRALGYRAIPSGNDTALSIPIAVDAGLGELGRNGLLITPRLGPRVRLAKVLTDLPLVPDLPIEFGVRHFCQICRKCAQNCPSQAIQHGDPTDKALNISNNPGVLKWPVDAEKCFAFWARQHLPCGNCIRVCPFNKSATGWLHNAVRWGVKHTTWLDSLFLRGDDLLGYARQASCRGYWAS